jgi:hypothetical protein
MVGAYLLAVVTIAPLERVAHVVSAADLASSPASLAAGKVWLLFTSGFVVVGPPLPQVATIALLAVLVIRFRGSRTFWGAALLGHVGSTLVVYAVVGLLWWADAGLVHDVIAAPDYGISCIWSAGLGAVAAGAWLGEVGRRRPWSGKAVAAAAVLVLAAVSVVSDDEIARAEHIVAFALGALVVLRSGRLAGATGFRELCCARRRAPAL